jgi:hypothetical protein
MKKFVLKLTEEEMALCFAMLDFNLKTRGLEGVKTVTQLYNMFNCAEIVEEEVEQKGEDKPTIRRVKRGATKKKDEVTNA